MRLACVAAVVLACARPAPKPVGRAGFVELESAHYVVDTDLDEGDARDAVAHLEQVRAALLAGSWRGDGVPQGRLRVIQLSSPERLREFANPGMSAFYQPSDLFGEPFLILGGHGPGASGVVLTHELAHAQHGSFLFRAPRWFSEGLACYLETLRYDAARDAWVIGEPAADRLDHLGQRPELDYGKALAAPTAEVVSLGGQEGFEFQSASWMAVFYLANERRSQLDDYVARLSRRESPQAAFAAAFAGLAPSTLAAEAARYRRSLSLGTVKGRTHEVRLPATDPSVRMRAVAPADVEAMRSELFFLSPGVPRDRAHLLEARVAAARALALDPDQPLALAVTLAVQERGELPAFERLQQAARNRPDDYRAQMLLALAAGPQRPGERRAALARAAQLAPQNATVLNALAWHDLTHGRARDAVPLAEKAAMLAPGRAAVLDTLATALALSSRCADGAAVEERALEMIADRAESELRRRLTARLQAMRAGCGQVPLDEE